MVRAMRVFAFPIAATILLAGVAFPAGAGEGAWAEGAKASVRLIAAGIGPDGTLDAGIEIVLPDGWHTYWRSPGDAGIAPSFDFSASRNVASAEVSFPAPARLDDGFTVTNIYEDRVVLPVRVVVTDPASPVDLAVTIDLGVCDDICVPDTVTASLTVPPGDPDVRASDTLAAARAAVPTREEAGAFAVTSAVRAGGTDKKPVFRISAVVPDPENAVLFVEGPDNWRAYAPIAVSSSGTEAVWDVKFSRRGVEGPVGNAELRLTITAGNRAIEQVVTAD